MVVTYSLAELYAIGERMTLKECLKKGKMTCLDNNKPPVLSNPELMKTFQELFSYQQQTQNNNITCSKAIEHNFLEKTQSHHYHQYFHHQQQDSTLTSSVAEFFRKAQLNFYAQTTIDPTKVRRLSEIEAELINGEREDTN